jgi:hypothetical protein
LIINLIHYHSQCFDHSFFSLFHFNFPYLPLFCSKILVIVTIKTTTWLYILIIFIWRIEVRCFLTICQCPAILRIRIIINSKFTNSKPNSFFIFYTTNCLWLFYEFKSLILCQWKYKWCLCFIFYKFWLIILNLSFSIP